MCIVSTVSSVRVVGNVSVCGVNKVELRRKKKLFKDVLERLRLSVDGDEHYAKN